MNYVREHSHCTSVLRYAAASGCYSIEINDNAGRLLCYDASISADSIESLHKRADELTLQAAPHHCHCDGWMRFSV